jgi:ABC-type lipoprotein export system ATPase subunit
VLDLFRALASSGTTVVIATHERDITRLVDRKVEVADGSLASIMAPAPAGVPAARR